MQEKKTVCVNSAIPWAEPRRSMWLGQSFLFLPIRAQHCNTSSQSLCLFKMPQEKQLQCVIAHASLNTSITFSPMFPNSYPPPYRWERERFVYNCDRITVTAASEQFPVSWEYFQVPFDRRDSTAEYSQLSWPLGVLHSHPSESLLSKVLWMTRTIKHSTRTLLLAGEPEMGINRLHRETVKTP